VLEPVQRVADADIKEWRRAFDVNFFAAVALVRTNERARVCLAATGGSAG